MGIKTSEGISLNAALDFTQGVHFTRQQAAEYLHRHLPFKSVQQWLNYLNDNARGKHAKTIHFAKKGVSSFYQRPCLDVFIQRKNQDLYCQVQHLWAQQFIPATALTANEIDLEVQHDGVLVGVQNHPTALKLSFAQAHQLMQKMQQHFARTAASTSVS